MKSSLFCKKNHLRAIWWENGKTEASLWLRKIITTTYFHIFKPMREKMSNGQFARGCCVVWVVRAGHIYFILWTLSTSINIAIKRMTGLHPLREIFHISGWIRLIGSCMELLNWYWCWLFIWSCVIWNNWNSEPITIVLMVAPCQALHSRCSVVEILSGKQWTWQQFHHTTCILWL